MADWIMAWSLIAAVALAVILAVGATLAVSPAAIQAQAWRQERVAATSDYWRRFQAEVMAELRTSPQPPPAPAGGPDPGSAVPPLYLYHGTRRNNMASIFARGIEGRSGGWAFAAPDYATAQSYGRRWGGDYVVFRVLAQQAYQAGTRFETRGGYYVARHIHPAFVDFHWALGDLAHRDGAVV